jgi:hypothetical protein
MIIDFLPEGQVQRPGLKQILKSIKKENTLFSGKAE